MMHQHPSHHHQFLHPPQMHHQVNMNQPPPPQLNCPAPHMPNLSVSSQNPQNSQQTNQPPHQRDSGRMNHHHQQRINHQQIHQQQLPPQGSRLNQQHNQHLHHNGMMMGNVGVQQQQQQQQQQQPSQQQQQNQNPHHQPPPQMMHKHLHQNIATLNQKPQHLSSNNSNSHQISTPRLIQSIEKPGQQVPQSTLKQRDSTINVSATATLSNNSSIVVSSHSASSAIAAAPPSSHQSTNLNLSAVNQQQQQQQQILLTSSSKSDHQPKMILTNPNNASGGVKISSTGGSFELQLNKNINLSNNKENTSTIISNSNSNADGSIGTILSDNNITIDNDIDNNDDSENGIDHLANTKEKTPMCLVNELARYNKIQHQYRLTGEQGPAHKKRFTVTLKLGDEEYTAEGLSIKKAQHAAAKEAIIKTIYKHPPLKTNRQTSRLSSKCNSGNITPTVELNALAMKRGEPTVYTVEPQVLSNNNLVNVCPQHIQCNQSGPHQHQQQQQQQHQPYMPPNASGSTMYNQQPYNNYNRNNSYHQQQKYGNNYRGGAGGHYSGRFNNHFGETYRVTLQVGSRTFTGMGPTQQAARHDAAARALEVLKPLTIENENSNNFKNQSGSDINDSSECDDSLINSEIKSPISIVHEMALKRKLSVSFEVQSEKGPPHMKTYTTLCRVGTIVTEGEGNGKKLSKKKAAEKMMDELKKLPPPSPVEEPPNRTNIKMRRKQQQTLQVVVKKKTRNLIKEKADQNFVEEINPISQLIQIQQARKEKEPAYTVIDERGTARRREFVIEVSASGLSATGTGPNKKMAKKTAAEKLLQLMGVGKTSLNAGQSESQSIKESNNKRYEEKSKKVQFVEQPEVVSVKKTSSRLTPAHASSSSSTSNSGGANGRQIVPGLLLVSQPEAFVTPSKPTTTTSNTVVHKEPVQQQPQQHYQEPEPVVVIEKPVQSPSSTKSANDSGISDGGVSARDQLSYLAQLIGFSVNYSDFPKGNHGEYLSLVTLTTDPPHMSHGNGSNADESRDQAASKALAIISEIGLDNIKPKRNPNVSPIPPSMQDSSGVDKSKSIK